MPNGKKYRCMNRFGDDPCQYAVERREISETEAIPGIDGPCCPGKTASGQECRELLKLERTNGGGKPKSLLRSPLILGGIVLVLLVIGVLVWWLLPSGEKTPPPPCGSPGAPACKETPIPPPPPHDHEPFRAAIDGTLKGAGRP